MRRQKAEKWEGFGYFAFWGFLHNLVLVVVTFGLLFLVSLFKVVITVPVSSFFAIVLGLSFWANMREHRMPKLSSDLIGMLWPLSLTWQAILGLATGVLGAFAQQRMRLHIHHDLEEEPLRYMVWVFSLFATAILQSGMIGIACNIGPNTLKEHSE